MWHWPNIYISNPNIYYLSHQNLKKEGLILSLANCSLRKQSVESIDCIIKLLFQVVIAGFQKWPILEPTPKRKYLEY